MRGGGDGDGLDVGDLLACAFSIVNIGGTGEWNNEHWSRRGNDIIDYLWKSVFWKILAEMYVVAVRFLPT